MAKNLIEAERDKAELAVAQRVADAINKIAGEKDKVGVKIGEQTFMKHILYLMNDDGYTRELPRIKERRVSSWRYTPTGEFYLVFESIWRGPSAKVFPQKKDGTHNYEGIAKEFIARREAARAATKRQNTEQANQRASQKLVDKLKELSTHPFYISSTDQDATRVKVTFDLDKLLTVEETQKLYDALKGIGLL